MSLDLAFDDGQQAIADAVAHFCADRFGDDAVKAATGTFARDAWRELAELGVLAVLTPDEDGGLLEAVAAVESLGAAAFPGPLAATFLATWVLEDPERSSVADGSALVAAGCGSLWPWGADASLFLEIDTRGVRERVFRASPAGPLEAVATLGGEPWARGEMHRGVELDRASEGLSVYRTVLAAQIAAMGQRLVRDAAEHAAVRKQFGRPIGDFQAVAHPLADAAMRLAAASTLAHAAAYHFDAGLDAGACVEASRFAAAAHASAVGAAREASYVCHQVFGAIGITLEGPVFHVSRGIRQLASLVPSPEISASRLTPFCQEAQRA